MPFDIHAQPNRHWVKAATPDGAVGPEHFRLESAPIAEPGDGEILVRTNYLSLVPVMRRYLIDGAGIEKPLAIGDTIHGRGVGQVVLSRHPDFAVGDFVHGKIGWQEYRVTDAGPDKLTFKVHATDLPLSLSLGVLGVTGLTAYVGLFDLAEPKPGETVLVSGAAGGVGSMVGPLAKIAGARVIGLAGGPQKCALLTERLGYDVAIDYKAGNVEAALREAAPDGIDVFFDNVGGAILDAALANLARFARITLCGRISQYLRDTPEPLYNWAEIGKNRARATAFFVYDYAHRFAAAERDMAQWIREDRLPYLEDVIDGIETMPDALVRLYEGRNQGKQLVHVADPIDP